MELIQAFNYDESLSYLKNKFNEKYYNFLTDFSNFKFTDHELISYCKIDNYAVLTISKIYNYDDFNNWIKENNIKIKEFDISSYL